VTNDCYAVWARTERGIGVLAEGEVGLSAGAEPYGIGVSTHGSIDGSDGMALYAEGPTVFTRSGVVTIPAGAARAKVRLKDSEAAGKLTSRSFVLVTPQQKSAARVFVRAAVPNVSTNSFTIYLNEPAPDGVRVWVGSS
jgi:hypothetical protein